MKKHIKRKYQVQQKLSLPDSTPGLIPAESLSSQEFLKRNYKERNWMVTTDDGDIYAGFIYNNAGVYVPIPLPDFTLVYYDFAYNLNRERKSVQPDLMNSLPKHGSLAEDKSKELYHLYGLSTSCIINLFSALESFVNHILPAECVYTLKKAKCTETYNIDQIQQHLPFSDKVKKAVPQILQKDFFKNKTPATQHIENLKNIRDKIVHTKRDDTYETHISTFKSLLRFKYDETLHAVETYFNFYRPGYIEPCPCNQDY